MQNDGRPEWEALGEERRNQLLERLSENERHVSSHLLLCNETLNMMRYLTSDIDIRKPFLLPELLPRLAGALLHLINHLVGLNSDNIKVCYGWCVVVVNPSLEHQQHLYYYSLYYFPLCLCHVVVIIYTPHLTRLI